MNENCFISDKIHACLSMKCNFFFLKRTYLNNYILLFKRTLIFVFCFFSLVPWSHFGQHMGISTVNILTLVIVLGKSFITGVAAKQCPPDWLIWGSSWSTQRDPRWVFLVTAWYWQTYSMCSSHHKLLAVAQSEGDWAEKQRALGSSPATVTFLLVCNWGLNRGLSQTPAWACCTRATWASQIADRWLLIFPNPDWSICHQPVNVSSKRSEQKCKLPLLVINWVEKHYKYS